MSNTQQQLDDFDFSDALINELTKSVMYDNIVFDELFTIVVCLLRVIRVAVRLMPTDNYKQFKERLPALCNMLNQAGVPIKPFGHFMYCTNGASDIITLGLDAKNICHLITPVGAFLFPNITLHTDNMLELTVDGASPMFEFLMWVSASLCSTQIFAKTVEKPKHFQWMYRIVYVQKWDMGPAYTPHAAAHAAPPQSLKNIGQSLQKCDVLPMTCIIPGNEKDNTSVTTDIFGGFMTTRKKEVGDIFCSWVNARPTARAMVFADEILKENERLKTLLMLKAIVCIIVNRCDKADIFFRETRRSIMYGPVVSYIMQYKMRKIFLDSWQQDIATRVYSDNDILCFIFIAAYLDDSLLKSVLEQSINIHDYRLPINSLFMQLCIGADTISPLYYAIAHCAKGIMPGNAPSGNQKIKNLIYYYEAKRMMQLGYIPTTPQHVAHWLPAIENAKPYPLDRPFCSAMESLVSQHPSFPFPAVCLFFDNALRTVVSSVVATKMPESIFTQNPASFLHISNIARMCALTVQKFCNNKFIGLSISSFVTECLIYPFLHDHDLLRAPPAAEPFQKYLQLVLLALALKKQNTLTITNTLFNPVVKTEIN